MRKNYIADAPAPRSKDLSLCGPVSIACAAFCALALAGCVGQAANTPPPPGPSVRFGHVFLVVEENSNYADVIANPTMPYLNSLANRYGLTANYFANAHPSTPNYFELTTGQTLVP
ncbi:MAG TPA: hypothetical protein VOA41_11475 [Candidatus Dormibacteraeota bacterium]|nr:hypothetical protein [Candidatus Dormibacteraeota bacterium]